MQSEVHSRIAALFPSLFCEGFAYRGFRSGLSEGEIMLRIRWETVFNGKTGFCDLRISLREFNDRAFELRAWIVGELQKHDVSLTNRRLAEMAA